MAANTSCLYQATLANRKSSEIDTPAFHRFQNLSPSAELKKQTLKYLIKKKLRDF
jgi:hypothetical protein